MEPNELSSNFEPKKPNPAPGSKVQNQISWRGVNWLTNWKIGLKAVIYTFLTHVRMSRTSQKWARTNLFNLISPYNMHQIQNQIAEQRINGSTNRKASLKAIIYTFLTHLRTSRTNRKWARTNLLNPPLLRETDVSQKGRCKRASSNCTSCHPPHPAPLWLRKGRDKFLLV